MNTEKKETSIISESVQDYLKTIHKLQTTEAVSTTDISKELDVSGASVTGMLKRLSTMGLVEYNSYKGVKLSLAGEKIALEIIRHHRLLELYLKEMLGYPLEKVHEEACRLEHAISDELGNKIAEMLGDPQYDPHGHPIPAKDGFMPLDSNKTLLSAGINQNVKIVKLSDHDPKLLEYLENMNLLPGVTVSVLHIEPFSGPVKIVVDGVEKIIGYEVANNIFVD